MSSKKDAMKKKLENMHLGERLTMAIEWLLP